MILNLCSLAFNLNIDGGGATPAWGTEMGQGEGYKFSFEDMDDFFTAMVYKAVPDIENVTCPLGKGGNQRADYDFVIASLFSNVFVNGQRVNGAQFLALIVKKINGDHHVGRRTLKYNPRMTYNGQFVNDDCYKKIAQTLGIAADAGWFVNEIFVNNQDEIHFSAIVVDGDKAKTYPNNNARKAHLESLLPHEEGRKRYSAGVINEDSRQIIYYGAPGTGKSYKVKEKAKNDNSIRTTFHPDSDYSTFVGAYKPTMGTKPLYGLFGDKTIRYNDGNDLSEDTISYKFIPQAFLKAYVEAWRRWTSGNKAPYYLVIEEINRGNCAQIFGDLFQLLDRDPQTGYSTYAIEADDDIRRFISEDKEGKLIIKDGGKIEDVIDKDRDIVAKGEEISNGTKLVLPPNLYIWATMNTSDQSLFPIDSAFKRRWDWEYRPIEYKNDDWYIEVGDVKYSWVDFQKEINKEIFEETSSEDKKLGDYFVVAKGYRISEETFKNKVLFYLWNDVFKDGECDLFKINEKERFSFSDFYDKDKGRQNLLEFMEKLGLKEYNAE